jgi:hypothetical protein
MDCNEFFAYNDTDYNNTDNDTADFDPRGDEDWQCWDPYQCSYMGYIDDCLVYSCSQNAEPWGYWCMIEFQGDEYECDAFYRGYEDYWEFYEYYTPEHPWENFESDYKPDNYTDPTWYCDDYNCTWFDDDLSYCYVQNCTNNQTWQQWCRVDWTTFYGSGYQEVCDEVFAEFYFSFDPQEDENWDCYNSSCTSYDDNLWSCNMTNCY